MIFKKKCWYLLGKSLNGKHGVYKKITVYLFSNWRNTNNEIDEMNGHGG